MSDWAYLRIGLAAAAALVVAALAVWAYEDATFVDRGFDETRRCLVNEKGVAVAEPRDPIARSADLGALRGVVETNGVTISVASTEARAERLVANYRAVGGDLGTRLERRGRTVYLWDRPPSPTQRQAVYDCGY